ncbi:hypothetical protein [Microbacterium sp. BG28]|uniref:hypothetical protein n=1 Tax=Microbacterium sp. BG28 TaxID=3097356 RepID=UPI002A5A5120|nr:hypothetical protein [Microbacterium sp. BG28]
MSVEPGAAPVAFRGISGATESVVRREEIALERHEAPTDLAERRTVREPVSQAR